MRFTAAALLKDDFLAIAIEYDPTGRAVIEVEINFLYALPCDIFVRSCNPYCLETRFGS